MREKDRAKKSTSWEPINKWYHKSVGEEGHYYHQHVVIPGLLGLAAFSKHDSILDLACGQGILARHLPPDLNYCGIDISPSLIKEAKHLDKNPSHRYLTGDVTKDLPIQDRFSHAFIILALQNIEHPEKVIQNAASVLLETGALYIVLNHPCFRIPRQSSWHIDQSKKLQYRRLDAYHSSLKIPIQAHPGMKSDSPTTLSFHHPLANYFKWLKNSGFVVTMVDEWYSTKSSEGGAAKMENRARQEFPLFMVICARLCQF